MCFINDEAELVCYLFYNRNSSFFTLNSHYADNTFFLNACLLELYVSTNSISIEVITI